jgi:hypothetical protein
MFPGDRHRVIAVQWQPDTPMLLSDDTLNPAWRPAQEFYTLNESEDGMSRIKALIESLKPDTPIIVHFPDQTISLTWREVLSEFNVTPPMPTPEPEPIPLPETWTVKVNTDALNVRSGPGTGYKIVTQLKRGAQVTISEQSGAWLRLADGRGWISAQYTVAV